MNAPKARIGIDYRNGLFYAARVEHPAGRPEVKALIRFERSQLVGHHLLEGAKVIFGVPDSDVILKSISLNSRRSDVQLEARFELAQSLLEDEKDFRFDTIATGQNNRYLGLIIRRTQMESNLRDLLGEASASFADSACQMRAAALARGYLTFCQLPRGDLICLADFGDRRLSIAFVYQARVIGLTHMALDRFDLSTKPGLEKMAVEFKTIANFKLCSFFEDGITLPLSALIVSGDGIDREAIAAMEKYFPIELDHPRLNAGFFSGQSDMPGIPFEKYLVALGLTVDWPCG